MKRQRLADRGGSDVRGGAATRRIRIGTIDVIGAELTDDRLAYVVGGMSKGGGGEGNSTDIASGCVDPIPPSYP